jgi:ankyrin repeat protein
MAAVSWGHVDVVNYLLSRGANINITDMDDDGLLHVCETVEIANILITNGVNPLKPNKYDKLPIHTAFEEGVEEMVELLKRKN